ncbi:hypothetical protein TNCV_3287071 [Trichonephila clavipes]|nr:hypothetical protein TNCV_3287071 [Trichonephila clavipes]
MCYGGVAGRNAINFRACSGERPEDISGVPLVFLRVVTPAYILTCLDFKKRTRSPSRPGVHNLFSCWAAA